MHLLQNSTESTTITFRIPIELVTHFSIDCLLPKHFKNGEMIEGHKYETWSIFHNLRAHLVDTHITRKNVNTIVWLTEVISLFDLPFYDVIYSKVPAIVYDDLPF